VKAKNPKIIEILNDVLTAELTAINQYFIHAKMCQNWDYLRLYDRGRKDSIDEMKHAEQLIERILFLDGVPNVQRLSKINVGESVAEQLDLDMALEIAAVTRLNDGIAVCRSLGDVGSADLLERILVSEEEHVNWLEAQASLRKQVDEAHYLAQQIRKDEAE
jgi:bacterioferritin